MTTPLKRFLACCAVVPLVACTMVAAEPGKAPSPAAGQQFVLQPGERVALGAHGSVRYLRLVNDSRCAPDVQCVWAGDAAVAFEWVPAQGGKQVFSLHTGVAPRDQDIGAGRLVLVSLARGPAPAATVRMDAPAP